MKRQSNNLCYQNKENSSNSNNSTNSINSINRNQIGTMLLLTAAALCSCYCVADFLCGSYYKTTQKSQKSFLEALHGPQNRSNKF